MTDQQKLLIVGPASPSQAIAAGICTQAALYFSSKIAVTIVISDHAPPAAGFPDNISVIRERDLRRQAGSYLNAKRLYILDDSYESLFALKLFQEAPGPWIATDPTLHNLIHARYKTDKDYPKNYFSYMERTLGAAGWHAAHSLSGGTRISDVIASEIQSFDALENYGPQIGSSSEGLSLPITPLCSSNDISTEDYFGIVMIGEGGTSEAIETLAELGKKVRLQQLTGSEPNLAELIMNADAVCLLDKSHRLPPAAFPLALSAGKAIITANQSWVKHLPPGARLNLAHSYALHQLVAAIASLIGRSTVRPWLEENTKQYYQTLGAQAQYEDIAQQVLSAPVIPWKLPASAPVKPKQAKATNTDTLDASNTDLVLAGTKKPYALIGAVPAQALVIQLFPQINWDKSPRFATPELTSILCKATGKPAPVVLSLLGFESLLIATNSQSTTANATHRLPDAHNWADVQRRLKEVDSAITFDCNITGLPKARALTPKDTNIPGGLVIDFSSDVHEDIKRQTSSGFLEKSGIYWQLNKIEHRIDCLLISGVSGSYQLSAGPKKTAEVPSKDVAFMVTDDQFSNLMTVKNPAVVKTDAHGVIQFSLSAAHPIKHYPLAFEKLLETLACTPLYLEWCSHG